jgi:AAA15 family ATPase/GTPase
MLIRFIVSNFLSFDNEVEFNMLSSSLKTHKHHVYNRGKLNLLKAAAIYGANGAGKSNLIDALEFLRSIVAEGAIGGSVNNLKFKLNSPSSNNPISFEIEVCIDKKVYKYGLSLNNSSITEEWLYESGLTKDDKLIFLRKPTRTGKSVIKIAEKYTKNQTSKLLIKLMEDNLLKHNELLLGKVDNLKIKEILLINNWFKNQLLIIFPHTKYTGLVPMFSTSEKFKNFANELLRTFDTGILQLDTHIVDLDKYLGEDEESLKENIIEELEKSDTVELETRDGIVIAMKEGKKYVVKVVVCKHTDDKGKLVNFEISEESDGTQRLLDFIPACNMIINENSVVIVDEIDQSLHPVLLRSLLHKIMADQSTQGQLIFTTHESNLLDLDIFRQDEIWFIEKSKKTGGSQLYSLSEFKPRYDLDIRKGYLKGRFGAIPFLANLEELNWSKDNA